MTMTTPGCGMANTLKGDLEGNLQRLPDVTKVQVEVLLDLPWNPSHMSEVARLHLGFGFPGGGAPKFTQIS